MKKIPQTMDSENSEYFSPPLRNEKNSLETQWLNEGKYKY